jgi:hypothetical protein
VAGRGHQPVRDDDDDAVVPAAAADDEHHGRSADDEADRDRLVPAAALQLAAALPRAHHAHQHGRLVGGVPPEREDPRPRARRRQALQKIFYFLTLYISRSIDN